MDNVAKTVVSTRVRFARNLEGYPFPSHLKDEKQAKEIIRLVSSALSRLDEFKLFYMDGVDEDKALSLQENHLISPNLIANRKYSAQRPYHQDPVGHKRETGSCLHWTFGLYSLCLLPATRL